MSEIRTVEDVRTHLAEIEDVGVRREDDEAAHGLQDELYEAVLEAIATGDVDAPALAAEALLVRDLAFSRWYA